MPIYRNKITGKTIEVMKGARIAKVYELVETSQTPSPNEGGARKGRKTEPTIEAAPSVSAKTTPARKTKTRKKAKRPLKAYSPDKEPARRPISEDSSEIIDKKEE